MRSVKERFKLQLRRTVYANPPSKGGTMSKLKTTMQLVYTFTREEKAAFADQLAKEIEAKTAALRDKKECMQGFVQRVALCDANIGRLSEFIRSGMNTERQTSRLLSTSPRSG
jgi:hypothetical protein